MRGRIFGVRVNSIAQELSSNALQCVGKHTEMADKQTGTETKKRTFTDAVKKGRLPQDLLSKGTVEQLNEVYGK